MSEYRDNAHNVVNALVRKGSEDAFFTGREMHTYFAYKNGVFTVTLYATVIVAMNVVDETVTFNAGDYPTNLTRKRINQVCNALGLIYGAARSEGKLIIYDLGSGEWETPCTLPLRFLLEVN